MLEVRSWKFFEEIAKSNLEPQTSNIKKEGTKSGRNSTNGTSNSKVC